MASLGFSGFSLFLVLCFGHCLCDYPLQSDKIARGKNPALMEAATAEETKQEKEEKIAWAYWMAGHAGTHALAVSLLTGNAWLGLAEFVAHFLIDWGKCRGLFALGVDQGLHLGCKAAWTLLA